MVQQLQVLPGMKQYACGTFGRITTRKLNNERNQRSQFLFLANKGVFDEYFIQYKGSKFHAYRQYYLIQNV
jgi:hypothetical protein